jgi:hypothetical protein
MARLVFTCTMSLDDVFLELDLVDEHRFANGVVHLHHRARR